MKIKRTALALAALAGTTLGGTTPVAAQDFYMGQVQYFAFNFCPRGWIPAQGQLLAISQYQALFSLFGDTYGGDARTTFGVPDLRGRTMIAWSSSPGPGLPTYNWGQWGGRNSVTLTTQNLPSHTHTATLRAENEGGTTNVPTNALLADFAEGQNIYADGPANTNMHSDAIQVGYAGNSQSFDITPPYLAMTACVNTTGLYPSRN